MQGCHNDHKTLEPHADIDDKTGHKHHRNGATQFSKPENLRSNHIGSHHDPVGPCTLTRSTIEESGALVVATTVPGDKKLHDVGIAHEHRGQQNDLVHVLQMTERNVRLEVENFAGNHEQR